MVAVGAIEIVFGPMWVECESSVESGPGSLVMVVVAGHSLSSGGDGTGNGSSIPLIGYTFGIGVTTRRICRLGGGWWWWWDDDGGR